MILITTKDLFYKDYTLSAYANYNSKICGDPDSTLLNRKQALEILYFINKFSEIHKIKDKETGIKIEKMIRNEVPEDLQSQINIKNWIEGHWTNSKY